MVIYRPHTGSLSESMRKAKEFNDFDEMFAWIADEWKRTCGVELFSSKDVVVSSGTIDDARVGWMDTRYVCIKRLGEERFKIPQCIGMCATLYYREVPV